MHVAGYIHHKAANLQNCFALDKPNSSIFARSELKKLVYHIWCMLGIISNLSMSIATASKFEIRIEIEINAIILYYLISIRHTHGLHRTSNMLTSFSIV